MNPRPRVLMLSRNLPPLLGGMERVNARAAQALAEVAALSVAGPRGCRAHLPAGLGVAEFPARPAALFVAGSIAAALRLARRVRPELVFCGSGTVAPAGLAAARLAGARFCIYVHGLDLLARHPLYRAAFLPAIGRADALIANSHSTATLARAVAPACPEIQVVHPGVALPALDARAAARARFRREHGLEDRRVLLIAGRLTARKGVVSFIRRALPTVAAALPDSVLLVVGEAPRQALGRGPGGGRDEILAAAAEVGLAERVRCPGGLSDAALSEALFAADLLVFPVLALPGDVEGFGMVCAEAAAHGLPTAAFAVGGVPEAVAEGQSGRLYPSGDYPALAAGICHMLEEGDWLEGCRRHAVTLEWERFDRSLCAALGLPGPGRGHDPAG